MVLLVDLKENSSDLKNHEEKQSEWPKNHLNSQLRNEPEQGKCLHYRTRIRYFETITRGQTNESKTIPKTHELLSIRSVGVENVV